MPKPDGGLITETNRQYYAGAQQFQASSTASSGQTFTSTFDVDLTFGSSDSSINGYLLNNFKVYTAVDAINWLELNSDNSGLTAVVATAAGVPSTIVDLTTYNSSIQVGDIVSGTGVTAGTKVVTITSPTVKTGTVETITYSIQVRVPATVGTAFYYNNYNANLVSQMIIQGGNIITTGVPFRIDTNVVHQTTHGLISSNYFQNVAFNPGDNLTVFPSPIATTSITLTAYDATILPGMALSGTITDAFGTGTTDIANGITVRTNVDTAGKGVLTFETSAGTTPGSGTLYTFPTAPWNGDTLTFSSQELTLDKDATLVTGAILTFKNSSTFSMVNNIVTVNTVLPASIYLKIQMNEDAMEDNNGSYSFTRLTDVIDNFLIAYVGAGKLIPSVKRTDVIFHAKRGLQEFSYDTLKSVRSQELTIPTTLSLIIPQDYVNYVRLSYVDGGGVQHTIFPANSLTVNPYEMPAQDNLGIPTQDSQDSNITTPSVTEDRWDANNPRNISGAVYGDQSAANVNNVDWFTPFLGQRYGMNPEISQQNGWFTINDREGKFEFTSNLSEKLIIIEYISDGNAYDLDSRIPKLAEEALYAHIAHAILSTSANIQEYVVRRFKQERSAKLRNAKIRLSNLKLDQIIQVMRGQSKWIK
jgi:hypothetical protein|tara:strand:+ start:1749 stop:3680 length:1932 start_codon:yes stop_codon:yes gene_type:complete